MEKIYQTSKVWEAPRSATCLVWASPNLQSKEDHILHPRFQLDSKSRVKKPDWC